MIRKIILVILFLSNSLAFTQVRLFDKPLSPRIANYAMKAKLLPEAKAVEGSYELNWWNASKDTIRELQFHLYLNGFKNEKSTFVRESGGQSRGSRLDLNQDSWGYVDIRSLRTADGEDYTNRMEFIQPDDGNKDDQTVMRIFLSKPILPNQSIQLHCEFYSKLPRVVARTGFVKDDENDFYLVGQWFPKIGVRRDHQWNCHQFHADTEFFADFGVYDLEITVPNNYIVGANAVLIKKQGSDSVNVYTFHQEDVIDAVWTASPNFKEVKQKIKIDATGKEIEVTYLLSPGRESMVDRYFECATAMFNYFHEWYGEYPYSNLTIVDPPLGEEFTAGGMEYPTLITTGSYAWFKADIGLRWLEIVTFHEFAHNYFQSMVATNEFEETWLDEGFTSFSEHRALERYFKEKGLAGSFTNFFGLPFNSTDYHRASYFSHPRDGSLNEITWKSSESSFQMVNYSKPTLVLATLQNYLGDSLFSSVMRTYFERWKFRHPQAKDLLALVNEISGKDLGWFFDQFINSSKTVDYQVVSISNSQIHDSQGWFGNGDQKQYAEESDSLSKRYRSTVRVRNNGDAFFPTPILVRFADGDSVIEYWSGKQTLKEFYYDRTSKVVSASVDPNRVNLLDLKLANNVRTADTENSGIARYTLRVLFWMQTLLQNITMFI